MNENENLTNTADQAVPPSGQPVLPDDETTCACCGAVVKIADCTEDCGGDLICPDCLEREYVQCADCGEWVPVDHTIVVYNGNVVCEDCADDYMLCEDCNEYYPRDTLTCVNPDTYGNRWVCEDCLDNTNEYVQCTDCGEWFTRNHISHSDAYHDICDNCDDDWCTCANCGEVLRRDDAVYDEEDCEYYCSDCAPEHSAIHEYGYKPDPIFGTTDDNDGRLYYRGETLTFGVELECDNGESVSDAVSDIAGVTDRAYCKHDGSLSDGYEIVTHPGTLAWHRECFPWAEVCYASRSNGFHSHDTNTCGLHVHVGRDQLGASSARTAAKMALIMARLKNWFVLFSRRKGESRWATYLAPYALPVDDEEALDSVYQKLRSSGRYLAVNVQPTGTVEIRIFRGSLVPETVLAAIELVSNLALYAREHSLEECLAVTWDELVSYETYPELEAYCAKHMGGTTSSPATFTRETPVDAVSNVFPWGSRIELESSPDSELQPGDIVYAVSTDPEYERVRGLCGLVIGGDGHWYTVAWFISDDVFCWKSEFDLRHGRPYGTAWGIARSELRRVTKIGEHTIEQRDREYTLNIYKTYGLLPGDLVETADKLIDDAYRVTGMPGRYLLSCMSNYYGTLCECDWPELERSFRGHDCNSLRPLKFSGWRIIASNLRRVDN